jgi:hypothetical protein
LIVHPPFPVPHVYVYSIVSDFCINMQSNHMRPQISAYNPRNSEKQRFSLKGMGMANNHALPHYMAPQDQYAAPNGIPAIWALFADLGKRIAHLARLRSSTQSASYSKELSSPSQSSQSTTNFVMLCALWYCSSALSSNTGTLSRNINFCSIRLRRPLLLPLHVAACSLHQITGALKSYLHDNSTDGIIPSRGTHVL